MSLIHPDLIPAMELLADNNLVCIVERENGENDVQAIYLSVVRPDGSELCVIRLPIAAESETFGEDDDADIAADERFVSLGRLFEAAPHLVTENKALKLAMGEAAAEIHCSGTVAHRIRVLKGHHNAQIWRVIDERDAAVKAREAALRDRASAVAECNEALSMRHSMLMALNDAIKRADVAEAEIARLQIEYAKRDDLPVYLDEVGLQVLANIRLNPYAVKLVVESYNGHGEWKGLRPYRFRFIMDDVEVYLGPVDRAAAADMPALDSSTSGSPAGTA